MSPDPTERELGLWRSARSLSELGDLAALFIEGEISSFPGWLAADVDEETDELVPTLALLNRSGFLTLASQPGREPFEGFGGYTFAQRAFVAGFASPTTDEALGRLALDAELLVCSYPATDRGGCQVPVGRRGQETTAWAGHAAGPEELEIFAESVDPAALEELRRSRYVSVIDPLWGRRDLLWDSLRRALDVGAHDEEPPT